MRIMVGKVGGPPRLSNANLSLYFHPSSGRNEPLHGDLIGHVLDLHGVHAVDHGWVVWKEKSLGNGDVREWSSHGKRKGRIRRQ